MTKPRGILIAGNWKMNHGPKDTQKFFQTFKEQPALVSQKSRQLIQSGALNALVFTPAISLNPALTSRADAGFLVEIGAQNVHWEKSGAFTGEISGPMLKELGISWTLVGHSERRQYFGETNQTVKKRAESHLAQGFKVVLCIGETRAERESNLTQTVLETQLKEGLPESLPQDGSFVLAYEPVWAIGTGLTASPEQAEDAHRMIRKWLWDRFGMDLAGRIPVLYGGSVTPENAAQLLSCPNIDGALVGGASLKPPSFAALLEAGALQL